MLLALSPILQITHGRTKPEMAVAVHGHSAAGETCANHASL